MEWNRAKKLKIFHFQTVKKNPCKNRTPEIGQGLGCIIPSFIGFVRPFFHYSRLCSNSQGFSEDNIENSLKLLKQHFELC